MAKRGINFLIYKPKKYSSAVTCILKKIFSFFIPNLSSFLKIHHHIFLYLTTFPSIHQSNRYPLLIFLPIPCFPYLVTILNHIHLVAIPEFSSSEIVIRYSSHSPLPTLSSFSPFATSEPSNLSPILTLDEPPLHHSTSHIQLLSILHHYKKKWF